MNVIVDVVVPTIGRPSLAALLDALGACPGPQPGQVLVVDDRPAPAGPLDLGAPPHWLRGRLRVLRGRAAGPAAARNDGWRAARAEWVAFLDDDVLPEPAWLDALADDLTTAGPRVGGVQGRITVPLPGTRRPTDWERNVRGLETARWATADMAYRRRTLAAVGGFDERFPRAYREDADLAVRVTAAGWNLDRGSRRVVHPVRPADRWVSVRLQRGNADDALMRALHGPRWRSRADVPRGRRPAHLLTAAAGLATALLALAGHRVAARRTALAWAGLTTEFTLHRAVPGPRDTEEAVTLLATSAVIPFAAAGHWLRGLTRLPALLAEPGPRPDPAAAGLPHAVLLDRDGTLVRDVPYNGDPAHVVPMSGARAALDRLRAAGLRLAVVSNQSGIGRGLLDPAQVRAVNRRVEQLLGPFDGWFVCPHGPDDGCACRKPAPGLVKEAAAALGTEPARCVVVGDIAADVEAALAAGARPVLVPTPRTRRAEIDAAPLVADGLGEAAGLILGGVA